MKSKTMFFGAAATAIALSAATISASPAQALIVGGNPHYTSLTTLPTTLTVTGEFNDGDLTGGFTNVSGLLVNSLNILAGSPTPGFNAQYGATSSFLSNFTYKGVNAVLNLLPGTRVLQAIDTSAPFTSTGTIDFLLQGEIRSALDGKLLANAIGGLSAGRNFKNGTLTSSNFSVDVNTTPIPTPALLPGLIGLGMGILRKRKKEMAAASAAA